jgi:CheY-like chemotaxis protein
MGSKPWRQQELTYPHRAVIVIDDNKSQASVHAGKIIQHFGCQAASASDFNELSRLFMRAKEEHCDIAAIICDGKMPGSEGIEIYDDIRSGRLNYFGIDIENVPFLLVTGDLDLQRIGTVRDATVLPRTAWARFDDAPLKSSIGSFVARSLGMELPPVEKKPKEKIRSSVLQRMQRINEDTKTEEYLGGYQQNDDAYLRRLKLQQELSDNAKWRR